MIEIRVYGLPAPQGSKRFVGMSKAGHGVMIESSKKVKPWREAVKHAALAVMSGPSWINPPWVNGPIWAEMIFTMERPKSAKKGAVPSKRYDLDKLVRSTCDALTDVGAYEDDARIVRCTSMKVFPGQHKDSLDVPGAVIRIWSPYK